MAHERFTHSTIDEFSSKRQRCNISEFAAVLTIDALILGVAIKFGAELVKINGSMSGKSRKDKGAVRRK